MTVFDIMPSLWLFLSFLFFVLYLFCEKSLAICATSASLVSLAVSLLSLPMYIQCFGFVLLSFTEVTAVFFFSKRKRKRISCAVSDITSKNGYVKLHGEVIEASSRDVYIKYREGELFSVKDKNGNYIMFGRHT